jgi:transcriptional regulator with GAF, ATPase, and Fis domain
VARTSELSILKKPSVIEVATVNVPASTQPPPDILEQDVKLFMPIIREAIKNIGGEGVTVNAINQIRIDLSRAQPQPQPQPQPQLAEQPTDKVEFSMDLDMTWRRFKFETTRLFIVAVLEKHNGNNTQAAKQLKIQRSYLSRLKKELNI